MLKISIATAAKGNFGNMRSASVIKYIVIHYTANDGDTAAANANYFKNKIVEASAHYFVDDKSIFQSVPDNFVAWSVGGKKYSSCATTGGGKWHGKCTNNNSISVELCDTVKNGKNDFTEATMTNAAELVRSLMKKYNVTIENVIRHFDVVGKICPKPFVEDEKAWVNFKGRLDGDKGLKIPEEFKEDETMKRYNTLNEVPTWAKPMVKDMQDKGCFSDKNKMDLSDDMLRTMAFVTRYMDKK